jgi:hypothetical protein
MPQVIYHTLLPRRNEVELPDVPDKGVYHIRNRAIFSGSLNGHPFVQVVPENEIEAWRKCGSEIRPTLTRRLHDLVFGG